jgi:hypothetical protein
MFNVDLHFPSLFLSSMIAIRFSSLLDLNLTDSISKLGDDLDGDVCDDRCGAFLPPPRTPHRRRLSAFLQSHTSWGCCHRSGERERERMRGRERERENEREREEKDGG